jgi:hypothetical protein
MSGLWWIPKEMLHKSKKSGKMGLCWLWVGLYSSIMWLYHKRLYRTRRHIRGGMNSRDIIKDSKGSTGKKKTLWNVGKRSSWGLKFIPLRSVFLQFAYPSRKLWCLVNLHLINWFYVNKKLLSLHGGISQEGLLPNLSWITNTLFVC